MKRNSIIFVAVLVAFSLAGCSLPQSTPAPSATSIIASSPTPLPPTATIVVPTATIPTATISLPTLTPTVATATASNTPTATFTATSSGAIPGSPSGPYAVILVASGDVLNVRAAPGANSSVVGVFAATANDVMRSGPTSNLGQDLWVQVQNPGGGSGWVNAAFLTEYIPPATFCADTRASALVTNFGNALTSSNGEALAALVSPAHGMTVRLWRNGNAVTFYSDDARWVFDSTYEHNWGAAPGSGMDTHGAFHVVVLPKLLDVLNATTGYTLNCNSVQTGGASYDTSWPTEYSNINFYSLYKAGSVGQELSWRTLLVGVEYVQNQPYIFSVTQMDWEP